MAHRSTRVLTSCGLVATLVAACAVGCAADDDGWEARATKFSSEASAADDEVQELLVDRAAGASASARAVIRSRRVGVRLAELGLTGDLRKADVQKAKRLQIHLFDDAVLRAELVQMKAPTARELTWIGRIEGEEQGTVALAIVGGVAAGQIRVGGNVYELLHERGDDYVVRQIDVDSLPPEQCLPAPDADGATDPPVDPDFVPTPAPDGGPVVDLLVAYTAAARNEAGSESAIQSQIASAVAAANAAYGNSQIVLTLRLVGTMEVAYNETNNGSTDLNALTSTSDGQMDEVHTKRNELGADAVSLVTSQLGSACGIGWIMTSVGSGFARNAFSVTDRSCLSNQTLAHELGHNMGSAHDPANSSSSGAYPYSYGYQLAGKFRTIMAYPCSGSNCPRINHFSNPNVSYDGAPTGNADQNNAQSLTNTAPTTAAFRASTGAVNAAPTAAIAANPTTGTAPLSVSFDGSGSSDSDGTIASHQWNFGDGSSGTGSTTNHTFLAAGSYTVTLTVTDNGGATGAATRTIVVSASTPTTPEAGTATDSGTAPPPPPSDGGLVCTDGRTLCGGTCVRLSSNASNCGSCGTRCSSGQYCSSGVCKCYGTTCDGKCVNLRTDESNCGACGRTCPTGRTCWYGSCR